MLVKWKVGTLLWVPLADVKEAFPVGVAEYAVSNKISFEPALLGRYHRCWERGID